MTTKNLGSATVSGGIARTNYTIPSDELVGDFTLQGTYVENDHYKEATATADFKVRIATTVTVSNVTANHGETATFTANVKYDSTLNVNEGQVQFKLGGSIIGTGNVSNGVATCSYQIPNDVTDGTAITANFLGTSTYGASATTTDGSIHIRGATTVTVYVNKVTSSGGNTSWSSASSINRGDTLGVLINVKDSSNQNITSGTVEVYLDNVKLGETNTTSSTSFKYTYDIPNNATTGSHTVKAVFLQDADNESGEGTSSFVVRMPTHIVANAVSANAGSSVNIVANIYDENNNIVTEGQATFTDPNNQTSNVSVGSGGTATKSVSIPANATEGSTITYAVVYNQNTNYTSATSVNIVITVRKTPVLAVNSVTANRGDTVYLTCGVTYNSENVTEGSVSFTLIQT